MFLKTYCDDLKTIGFLNSKNVFKNENIFLNFDDLQKKCF